MAASLPLPRFYCPIPSQEHPGSGTFDSAAISWLQRKRLAGPHLLPWLTRADLGGLTGRTMPHGDTELLHVVARLHAVLFALDDGLCDEVDPLPAQLTRETQRILRVLEAPQPARSDDSEYAAALREIRLQLEEHMTGGQLRRWVEGMRTYLTALPWEAELRRAPGLPSTSDYVTMWMRAIGMAPSTALMEAVGGYVVPDGDLEEPGVRACTEMTWTLVAWDNDLYSRPKEVNRAGDTLNLVDVLAAERGIPLDEAQEQAVAMRDAVMSRFLTLRAQLIPQVGVETRRYLTDLGSFLRGHLDWARDCPRYALSSDSGPGGWWKSHPSPDATRPVAIDSIDWWWQFGDSSTRNPTAEPPA